MLDFEIMADDLETLNDELRRDIEYTRWLQELDKERIAKLEREEAPRKRKVKAVLA